MPHADFLELLLSDEVTRRENGSAARRARAAGLAPDMRLDSWDPSAAVRYDQQLWNELATLRFAEVGHGALIMGPVGVGKTHLATALGHIAVRRRLSVHMARAGQLFKKLKAARLDNTTEAEHRRLAAVSVLIIADFTLTPLDEMATADFYELTVARHHRDIEPHAGRVGNAHERPAPGPVRRRPSRLHLPRARRRGRVLPPPPAARHRPGLTKTISYPKLIQQPQGGP